MAHYDLRCFQIQLFSSLVLKRVKYFDLQPGNSGLAALKIAILMLNSLTTKKKSTKFLSAVFKKMISPSYIILRTQRLEGKQCRSRLGGSLQATSSRSTLFANSLFSSLVLEELKILTFNLVIQTCLTSGLGVWLQLKENKSAAGIA